MSVTVKPVSCWDLVEDVIGSSERVLLFGPSGTGKSWAARRINLGDSQVYSVSLTEDTPAAELRGHYGMVNGNYKWLDGPCVMAWGRPPGTGQRLNLNELEKASGDAQTFLLGILDDMAIAQQTLPTGEHIKPQPGFHVVATMNGDPEEDLNPALRDRFPICIHIDRVSPAAIQALPPDLRAIAANSGIIPQAQRRISVRCWNEFHLLRGRIGSERAAACVFGAKAQAVLDHLKVGAA